MANSAPESRRRTLVYATILFWQTREFALLGRCVDSLLAQNVGDDTELRILLIDNGSGATPCLPAAPALEFIRLPANRGFAGGHNFGLRLAIDRGAEYVLLFNSDAIAHTNLVRDLLAAAQAWPSAAFFGPLIIRLSVPQRIESAGQSFDVRTARQRELSQGQPVSSVDTRPHRVDAVSGCALLARCRAINTIGLLDESFFAYFEDMEWCLRAGRAGYQVVVVPAARVLHLGRGSTGAAAPLVTFYSVRNHMLVAARHSGRIRGRLLMVLAFGYHLAFLMRARARRNRRHLVAVVQGAWAAQRGQLGERRTGADWD